MKQPFSGQGTTVFYIFRLMGLIACYYFLATIYLLNARRAGWLVTFGPESNDTRSNEYKVHRTAGSTSLYFPGS